MRRRRHSSWHSHSTAVCRHAPASRAESIQEAAGGEISLQVESDSDDGIDSDDEEDEYEHCEKLVTTRILVGLDLETLNHCLDHCLVCYGCDPARRRRVAASQPKNSRVSSFRKRTARIRSESRAKGKGRRGCA